MNRNVIYVRILLVIISVVVVLAFLNRAPQETHNQTWLPSSFNPVGDGHMAFFQTLQEMHWPVDRWREPLSRLSTFGNGNTLIVTRAKIRSRVSFSDQEIDLLVDWVSKGNTLVLLGPLDEWDDTRQLLRAFGFGLQENVESVSEFLQPFSAENAPSARVPVDPETHRTGTLFLPRTKPLRVRSPAGAELPWEELGQPYVVTMRFGSGRVVCGASALWLDNQVLPQADNLAILLGLLAPGGQVPGHIFFEESHHGFSAVYALTHLLNAPGLRFAGLLVLLGAITFLGSSLVRFGPILPLQRETGRSTLEFVDSIADLYVRADLRDDTMQYLFHETHQRVLLRLNLPPTASHELIASRLQLAHPHLPKWKKLAQRFDSTDYTDGLPPTGWLRVARELIEIKSAMA